MPFGSRRAWFMRPSANPSTHANVVTTGYSDWATNWPEFKVTAVQVGIDAGSGTRSTLDKLVHMANQIAVEFGHQQPGAAVEATYGHLWHFLDSAMRRMIVAHLATGGAGLDLVAREAVTWPAAGDAA
jgi:formate dehydrogenase subunit delta